MSTYNPHAILAEWLESGWEAGDADCERATCFVKPEEPGSGWGATFGTWQQSHPQLHSFDSSFDAWAFVVAATGMDPLAGLPDSVKKWTKRPRTEKEPDMTPVQAKMF